MKTTLWLMMGLLLTATVAHAIDDPTRPYRGDTGSYEPVSQGPALQSTRISGEKKTAVINGRTVSLGDTIDGAIVADIQPYEVILNKGGRETTLRMLPRIEKRTTKVNE